MVPECVFFFFFKQKTAYEMRISDWSSDVCSSDLARKKLHEREINRKFLPPFFMQIIKPGDIMKTVFEQIAQKLEFLAELLLVDRLADIIEIIGRGLKILGHLQDRKSTRLNSSH